MLFGTMHIRDDRVYQFCHTLYPFIRQCDRYIGEMDFNSAERPAFVPRYHMKSHFSEKVYAKMQKQLGRSFGINVATLDHLHPMMLLSALSQRILALDHAVSLDEHLWQYAVENDIPCLGLESILEQMELLHSINPAPLYQQLRAISKCPARLRRFTHKALDYYVSGDIHRLYQLTQSSMRDLRKSVIYRRNEHMTHRILKLDQAQSNFITVGAGHLSGPAGLISRLRRAGWKVRPVRFLSSNE